MRLEEVTQREEGWGQRGTTVYIKCENTRENYLGVQEDKQGGEGRGAKQNHIEYNNIYTRKCHNQIPSYTK